MKQARKAELLLTYTNQEQQLDRIREIMKQVIDTGKEYPVKDDDAAMLGDNWYIKMSIYGDFHYLWLGSFFLMVGMNVMGWEPPWTGLLPGSTTERVAKFSLLWTLDNKELAEEAKFLLSQTED